MIVNNFTPKKAIIKDNKLTVRYTVHRSFKVPLCGLPTAKGEEVKETKWNLRKPGVCKKFEKASDNIAEKMTEIVDNEIDMDEVINKVNI